MKPFSPGHIERLPNEGEELITGMTGKMPFVVGKSADPRLRHPFYVACDYAGMAVPEPSEPAMMRASAELSVFLQLDFPHLEF